MSSDDGGWNPFCEDDGIDLDPDFSAVQIKWEKGLMDDNGSRCKVDRADFRIMEPKPFDEKWFSKKFKGPGVRHEVGVCIQTGWIVWTNGPFPCGAFPDLKIAKEEGLVDMFVGDERAVADNGYRGYPEWFDIPWKHLDDKHQKVRKSLVRARHECINRKFKQWGALKQVWRHDLAKHGTVFTAIANIEQLKLQQKEGATWHVDCFDRIHNSFNL